jgi:hypothetical protein
MRRVESDEMVIKFQPSAILAAAVSPSGNDQTARLLVLLAGEPYLLHGGEVDR